MWSSFLNFIWLNCTLPAESVDNQHCPLSLCLYDWVNGWFGKVDPSTRTTWYHSEPWTYVVFPCCSKLQLVWCSDQWLKCPWLYGVVYNKIKEAHQFIEVFVRHRPHILSVQCGPHENPVLEIYTMKYMIC